MEFDWILMLATDPRVYSTAKRGTQRSRARGKKWTFTSTTRGSNFHDEEEFPAQSGMKQGSLKRRGSGFVSTGSPPVRLPKSPRGKPFSMTIEFRCAKVRREKSGNRFQKPLEIPSSAVLALQAIEETCPHPRPFVTFAFQGPAKSLVFGGVGSRKNGPSAKHSEV